MNLKSITIFTFALASLVRAEHEYQVFYPGPRDASVPPHYNMSGESETLGTVAKMGDVGGVADVFEEGHSVEHGMS